jgi:hypothetical protein
MTTAFLRPVFARLEGLHENQRTGLLRKLFDIVPNILENTCICFGAFELYHDNSLHDLINSPVKLLHNIDTIFEFPKFAISIYNFFTALSRHLSRCNSDSLFVMLRLIKLGLTSISKPIVEKSVKILDGLTSYPVNGDLGLENELQGASLLLWQLLLNGKIEYLLIGGQVLYHLAVRKPETVPIVKHFICRVVPEEKVSEFEGLFRKFEETIFMNDSRPELDFSVHLQRLTEMLKCVKRPTTLF